MDISRERKTIETSEITSLNSAVIDLVENMLGLFIPTAATESAGGWHPGNHLCVHVCVRARERREGVSKAYKDSFLMDKELVSNFEVTKLCVIMTLLDDHKGRKAENARQYK